MARQVHIEIRTINPRSGRNGTFYSMNVADSGRDGFERLPEAQFTSFTLSNEADWNVLKDTITKALKAFNPKATLHQKKDANGKMYWSTKGAKASDVSAVVQMVIELSEGASLAPQYDSKLKCMVLKISGTALKSSVEVRGPRPGNGVR